MFGVTPAESHQTMSYVTKAPRTPVTEKETAPLKLFTANICYGYCTCSVSVGAEAGVGAGKGAGAWSGVVAGEGAGVWAGVGGA